MELTADEVKTICKEVAEDDMLDAIMFGHEAIKELINFEGTVCDYSFSEELLRTE